MKRRIKTLILLLVVLIIPTGCMKVEGNIRINKDKSMNYSLVAAYDTSKIPEDQLTDIDVTEEEINEFKKSNITLEKYEEDNYVGKRFSIKYESIDDISSMVDIDGCVIDIQNKATDTIYCFKREKGFFQDTYKAKFLVNGFVNSGNTKQKEQMENSQLGNNEMASSMYDSIDVKFLVEVPFKVKSNNASSKDNDLLTWDFKNENVQNLEAMEFEFAIPNTFNIIITIVVAVIFVLLIVGIIISKMINKNKPQEQVVQEEVEEVLELPQEQNAKINALLSDDGSDVKNL